VRTRAAAVVWDSRTGNGSVIPSQVGDRDNLTEIGRFYRRLYKYILAAVHTRTLHTHKAPVRSTSSRYQHLAFYTADVACRPTNSVKTLNANKSSTKLNANRNGKNCLVNVMNSIHISGFDMSADGISPQQEMLSNSNRNCCEICQ